MKDFDHSRYQSYVSEPITELRKAIFEHLIRYIKQGDVCDLGSHAVGHYWALGYIEQAETFSCFDANPFAVELQKSTIANLTGDVVEDLYQHTLDYLRDIGLCQASPENLAELIKHKAQDIIVFDFLQSSPQQTYDYVLALQSLEVVSSVEEAQRAIATALGMLRKGGELLCAFIPYKAVTDHIVQLRSARMEGAFNPDIGTWINLLKGEGFDIVSHTIIHTAMQNHAEAHLIQARR